MLINVGLGWADDSIPQEVLGSVRNKSTGVNQDYLHEVDFIQLSNFLFKNYAAETSTVLEKIRHAKTIADLNLDTLRSAVPQSNWERYFSSLVACDANFLKMRWERLYEKRNQIAHNRNFSVNDYNELSSLVKDLSPILRKAIDILDEIKVSQEDKEGVAENIVADRNTCHGEFLDAWSDTQHTLYELGLLLVPDDSQNMVSQIRQNTIALVGIISNRCNLSEDLRSGVFSMLRLKNIMVRQPSALPSDEEIKKRISDLHSYRDRLWGLVKTAQSHRNSGRQPDTDRGFKDSWGA